MTTLVIKVSDNLRYRGGSHQCRLMFQKSMQNYQDESYIVTNSYYLKWVETHVLKMSGKLSCINGCHQMTA